jgi:hypothetical protein
VIVAPTESMRKEPAEDLAKIKPRRVV